VWIGRDTADRTLSVVLGAPKQMRSGQTRKAPIQVTGLAAGSTAHITVAAVDVGILNITRFDAPSPSRRFDAQTRLGAEIRDIYGRLIDGMSAERGTMRSGGDADTTLKLDAAPPMWKTVAQFSGIVTADAEGRADVTFDIPEFAGTVRLMAVAWSDTKVGSATQDVIVRDPLTVSVATPRFLALGDRGDITLEVHNVDAPAGSYDVALSAVTEDGPVRTLLQKAFKFATGQRRALIVPVSATALGDMTLTAVVRTTPNTESGPTPVSVRRTLALRVLPAGGDVVRRTPLAIAPGASITLGANKLAGLIDGTATLDVTAGPSASFNVPGLLTALDRYPYGCTEQTISRALPLLYANALGVARGLDRDTDLTPRITAAIQRVLGRQDSSGGFGLWSPSSPDLWLTAYTGDFLSRARDEGHDVPSRALEATLTRLSNFVSYTQSVSNGGRDLAYALYVLARNGRVPAGELRYYAETKLAAFTTAIGKAHLGAALAMIGDKARAKRVMQTAADAARGTASPRGVNGASRADFGSTLRDQAAVTALAAEAGFQGIARAAGADAAALAAERVRHSTQEQAWLLLAARALDEAIADRAIVVDGKQHRGRFTATRSAAQLTTAALVIGNPGSTPLTVSMTATGASRIPEPATSQGISVERRAYALDGTPLNLASLGGGDGTVRQNEQFVMVLTVKAKARGGRLLLVDRLPAGLEIENPTLVDGGSVKALGWLKTNIRPVHTAFKDDRFVAAYNLFGRSNNSTEGPTFSAAYIVRAVTPGTFAHPAATVEDMYQPERHARTEAGTLTVTRER
ncbi:MAG: alpha-2-macroglobulin family protein, partial [Pseudomonadota bacterium]